MTATDTAHRTEAAVGIPWRSPALVAILAATLVTPMDVPLVSPLLPEIQAVFGVSESHAGLLITLYAVPGIVLAPVIGALADRIGRRYVLSGCLVVFGLAGTAIAFTTEFRVALGLRLLQGFREYDLPTFDADDQDAGDASQLRAHLRQADAILLGSPMYHGSFSSPLKTALDYSGFDEFEETTVGLVVVSGGSFPRPALEQLRSVTRALDAWTLPTDVGIPNSYEQVVDGTLADESLEERLHQLGTDLVRYAGVAQYPAVAETTASHPHAD